MARRNCGVTYGALENAYIERVTAREGYERAMDACRRQKPGRPQGEAEAGSK